MTSCRPTLPSTRRLVLKLGTRVLTESDGSLAAERLRSLVEEVVALHRSGVEVLLVSSGAVGLGREALQFTEAPARLADRQACAAVGQSRLMAVYQKGFGAGSIVVGQVLLTEADLDDRLRYLNLRSTLTALLDRGVVPVLNENDAVATDELAFIEGAGRPVFGDNDRLSALVATKLDADLLVLLTDVPGVFDGDPDGPEAVRLLSQVVPQDYEAAAAASGPAGGSVGTGGMQSKVAAALVAAQSGCDAVIASGLEAGVLGRVLAGEDVGTWFPAAGGLNARERWIAYAAAPRGSLVLDEGAVYALQQRGASLLAVGVKSMDGGFERGDLVELFTPSGVRVGRGLISCSRPVAERWAAGEAPDGVRNHDALVHRSNLVLDPGASSCEVHDEG